VAALVASLLLAVAGVAVTALPASAHDQLISTSPADGATVDRLPSEVTLTFGQVVLDTDGGTRVKVTDASGATISTGPTVVTDNVVSQRVAGGAAGTVTVLWRVVSADGHPVSGEFSFDVREAASSAPPATVAPRTGTAQPSPSPAPASASPAPVIWVIAGILVVVIVIVVIALLVTRRRGGDGDSPDDRES